MFNISRKIFYFFIGLTLLYFFNLKGAAFEPQLVEQISQKDLNEQSILAINWIQNSGEYRALAYQAFNIGQMEFDRAMEYDVLNPAVIVDLDETLLDNTPYQAALIGTEESFNSETWNQWILAEETRVVPGGVEFVNNIQKHGGKVFFVSNRGQSQVNDEKENDLEIATMNNMLKLGFNDVSEETLLLKGEFAKNINGKLDTSKKWRMEAIANGEVDGIKYSIVMLVGDNLNDFSEIDKYNNQIRQAFVDQTKEQYGIVKIKENGIEPAYISLPNPMYGYWENGLYDAEKFGKKSIWDLTPTQKSLQRIESLIRWKN